MICSLILAAAMANPIVEMFPRELTFLSTFDDGTLEPSLGKTTKGKAFKDFALDDDGVFGKALVSGYFSYAQDKIRPLVDTSKPGTLICWVRLNVELKPNRQGLITYEPGFTFIDLLGPDGSLLVKKSDTHSWGKGAMQVFACTKDKFGKSRMCNASAACTCTDWKVGEWRMVAAAWTAEKLYISVNGRPFSSSPLAAPLKPHLGPFYLQVKMWRHKDAAADAKAGGYAVDEVAALNRKLSDEEVAALYAATLKSRGR